MKNSAKEVCPKCQRRLEGAIEVSSGIVGGVNFVVMQETPDRNWIDCDGCGKVLCKKCCTMPDSGYCDRCFYDYKIAPRVP